jgi:hypothetical protein
LVVIFLTPFYQFRVYTASERVSIMHGEERDVWEEAVVASSQIKFSREISKSRGEESAVKRAR